MNFYPHHIGDFNSATRHLTRVERSLYRDLIEAYYDTELPLPADDFDRLCRKVMAHTEDEKKALEYVLGEFFILNGEVYIHVRCEFEIEKYRANTTLKSKAGKASAEARRIKKEQMLNGCSTDEQQNPTNQEPVTSNQEPITNNQEKEKTPAQFVNLEQEWKTLLLTNWPDASIHQQEIIKLWIKQEKTIEQFESALISTAASRGDSTRWSWVSDLMSKKQERVRTLGRLEDF